MIFLGSSGTASKKDGKIGVDGMFRIERGAVKSGADTLDYVFVSQQERKKTDREDEGKEEYPISSMVIC